MKKCFGGDERLRVARAVFLHVDFVDAERHMDILSDVRRVDYETVVGVSALVEDFGVDDIERAEFRCYFREVDADRKSVV